MSAQFPSAIVSPRTIANRVGVVYDADDQKTFFAEDLNNVNNEVVAIENALGVNLENVDYRGWKKLATIPTLQASDAPVYTLRFGADMTAFLAQGQRIKLTQHGAIKYFIVVSVGAYTGGNTDVDVYGGTDYAMENTGTYPVTLPNFSMQKAPFGFPLSPEKWSVETEDATERSQSTPVAGTWYNLGSLSIAIPKGIWDVYYNVGMTVNDNTSTSYGYTTLSTANNSESDADFSACFGGTISNATGVRWRSQLQRRKLLALTSKATYYLNAKTQTANITDIRFAETIGGYGDKTIIRAVCALL